MIATRPKVVWQWAGGLMYMGIQRNPDGTGYKKLEAGDEPRHCEYCDSLVTDYPHSHNKQEYEATNV